VNVKSIRAVRPFSTTVALSGVLSVVAEDLVNCSALAAGTITVMMPASQSAVVTFLQHICRVCQYKQARAPLCVMTPHQRLTLLITQSKTLQSPDMSTAATNLHAVHLSRCDACCVGPPHD
jgi:hypothetical protein